MEDVQHVSFAGSRKFPSNTVIWLLRLLQVSLSIIELTMY
jgi:hypothetical protein